MKKIIAVLTAFCAVTLIAVLAVIFVKNGKISYVGNTAADNSAVSAETVTEKIMNETTVVADSMESVIESTSVSEDAGTLESFNGSQNTTAGTYSAGATSATTAAGTTAAAGKTNGTTAAVTTTKAQTTAAAASTYEYSYAGFNPTFVTVPTAEKDLELFLVNRDYVISSDYTPTLAYAVTGDTNSKKLDYRVAPHYNEMYQAALKDGITLTTVSGYRSYSLQKSNFERKIQKYMDQGYSKTDATKEAATIILPPGTSEHNVGIAMDIISLEQNFENTKAFAWLQENAADYGFILRYPKDKQDITKIIYEPWHWRYVGVENAKAIKASGKCLEEYLGKA